MNPGCTERHKLNGLENNNYVCTRRHCKQKERLDKDTLAVLRLQKHLDRNVQYSACTVVFLEQLLSLLLSIICLIISASRQHACMHAIHALFKFVVTYNYLSYNFNRYNEPKLYQRYLCSIQSTESGVQGNKSSYDHIHLFQWHIHTPQTKQPENGKEERKKGRIIRKLINRGILIHSWRV